MAEFEIRAYDPNTELYTVLTGTARNVEVSNNPTYEDVYSESWTVDPAQRFLTSDDIEITLDGVTGYSVVQNYVPFATKPAEKDTRKNYELEYADGAGVVFVKADKYAWNHDKVTFFRNAVETDQEYGHSEYVRTASFATHLVRSIVEVEDD